MVHVDVPLTVALAACLVAAAAAGETVDFVNKCTFPIELYHSQKGSAVAKVTDIAIGATFTTQVSGPAHMYRHSASPSSTLIEMACDDWFWYDISTIPPMPAWCASFEECRAGGTKTGFNVPVSVVPKANVGKGTCAALECAADDKIACADAYHFPKDDIKTHSCPRNSGLVVTFCFANGDNADQGAPSGYKTGFMQNIPDQDNTPEQSTGTLLPDPTAVLNATVVLSTGPLGLTKTDDSADSDDTKQQQQQQTPDQETPDQETPGKQGFAPAAGGDLGEVKVTYSYEGKYAGNVPGSYDRVADLTQCVKEPVSVHTPVGPLSEPVSLIFRGPMEINNIAVFSAAGDNGTWSRVSSYSRETGAVENMVFLNNMNPDFSGKGGHGPQGYASEDGKTLADGPTVFSGVLAEASDPSKVGGGPGVATGAEVNIMTAKKCTEGECLGYFGDNDYLGWGGGKKAFVTEVKMPKGAVPDQPAIWMLNAQVMQSNQYACNCRGMGPVGGCGELDIAEVIETNPARDMVTTHYYFYDGSILSQKGDNFAPRSYDSTTVYVTLIDDSNDGLVKIVELASFDFTMTELGSLYQQLVDC